MGKHVDIDTISNVAIMTIEGGKDDISAPGQCSAAIELCRNVPQRISTAMWSLMLATMASSQEKTGELISVLK